MPMRSEGRKLKDVTLSLADLPWKEIEETTVQSSPRYIACDDHRLYQPLRSKFDEHGIPH